MGCVKLQQWKCRKRNQLQELLLPKSQHLLWPVESTHFPKPKHSGDMYCASSTNLEREFQPLSVQRRGRRVRLSSVWELQKSANLLLLEQFSFCSLVFIV